MLNHRTPQSRLDALRGFRTRPERDASMQSIFDATAKSLERTRKRLSGVGGAWEAVCPPELADKVRVDGLSRGVLTLRVRDSAASFELDRRLREGLEAALIAKSRAPVRRVKVVVGG